MKKMFLIFLCLIVSVCSAQPSHYGPYDPGAIRSDGTNASDTVTFNRVRTATGTAAAPAYSFSTDPDTGIYSPAADNLAVSVAGAEALRVNSAGEMLIATSTDAGDYKLQLAGTGLFVNDAFDKHIVLRRGLNDAHLSPTTSPDNGLWVWAGSDYTKGVKTFASGTFLINAGPLLIATNTETIGFKLINNGKTYFTDEVLINTTTDAGDYKLQVNGNAYVNGALTYPSTSKIFPNGSTTYGDHLARVDIASGSHVSLGTVLNTGSLRGRLTITSVATDQFSFDVQIKGTANSAVEYLDPENSGSVASGTANMVNVIAAGGGVYFLQNLKTSNGTYVVRLLGS